MTKSNSISSFQYLLYLIVFILSGCAEKPSTHSFINESPVYSSQVQYASSYTVPTGKYDFSRLKVNSAPSKKFKTVWDRLLSLYAIPEVDNERIEKQIQRYLKHPEYLTKIQQRAEPYLYFILDEIESKNLPGELALLPVVESAFKPHALSKSKASGLWQFMPATGRLFGLKQNWWYDGRKDIYTSTQAAATYLQELGKLYDDDWLLTLAAYNAGKGTIRKAIRKNRENDLATDFWSLPLRHETMIYVPRLLAIAKIFANADKYNLALIDIPNKPYFTVVNIDSQLDMEHAAEMANTAPIDFYTLNPAFKRGSTDPDGPFHLLIHIDKTETFKSNLIKTVEKDRNNWLRHQIKPGENLGIIAKQHNTSVNALRQANKLNTSNIRAGHFLLIPSSSAQSTVKNSKQFYIVQKGDTFWDIAKQFSVKSKDIATWNKISLKQVLQPGQKLIIKES